MAASRPERGTGPQREMQGSGVDPRLLFISHPRFKSSS